jgi:hypothetical protein
MPDLARDEDEGLEEHQVGLNPSRSSVFCSWIEHCRSRDDLGELGVLTYVGSSCRRRKDQNYITIMTETEPVELRVSQGMFIDGIG